MSKPALAVGLLAVMAGTWYWALMPPVPRVSPPHDGRRAASTSAAPTVPVVHLDQLTGRVGERPAPRRTRNPFLAAPADTPPVAASAAVGRVASPIGAVAADPAPIAWPRLELIGLAEARQAGSVVRIAIIAGPQGVLHVGPGDVVAGVYRLERIAADGIDMRLLPEDRLVRLSLRR